MRTRTSSLVPLWLQSLYLPYSTRAKGSRRSFGEMAVSRHEDVNAPGACVPNKLSRGVVHCFYEQDSHRCIGYSPLFSGGSILVGTALCLRGHADARGPVHSPQSVEFGYARRVGTDFGGFVCVLPGT